MIYVIAYDCGVEGYSGPVQAFETVEEAVAVAALEDRMVVFGVPQWPEPAQKWCDVEPLGAERKAT